MYGRVYSHLQLRACKEDVFMEQVVWKDKLKGYEILTSKNETQYINFDLGDIYFQRRKRKGSNQWEFLLVRQNSALKKTYPEIPSYHDLPDDNKPFEKI